MGFKMPVGRKLAQLMDRDAFAVFQLKQNASFLAEAYQRRSLVDGLNGINKERISILP
jgi:3-methyladenine DNA glycosylase AlkC